MAGPTKRNAVMTFVLPGAVAFGGLVLSVLLALLSPSLGGLGLLVELGGAAWYVVLAIQMVNELKAASQSESLAWWPMFVPFYSMYWAWVLVPEAVTRAKQRAGTQEPTRPILFYVFLWHYALASDLNDLVR